MKTSLRLLATAATVLLAVGCNRQGPEVPRPVNNDMSVEDHGNGVESVVVNPNAAKSASEIDEDGAVVTPAQEFSVGQTIYISVPTQYGRKVGDRLEVFWFHDDGQSRKEDTKVIEGPHTAFQMVAQDPGPYNVEVDANGRPIALVQFTVK